MRAVNAVVFDHATVRLGGHAVLEDFSLAIEPGARLALVGPNGAGKSTVLRALCGFVPLSGGRIEALGEPVVAGHAAVLRSLRGRIGCVFQGLHLVGRLTALENVLIGGLARAPLLASCLRRFAPAELAAARDRLAEVGIAELADRRTDALSGGERQRVAIARALHQAPSLLLADEPTAHLDPRAARDVLALLRQTAERRGIALLTVLHAVDALEQVADTVVALRAGRLAWRKPVETVSAEDWRALYAQDTARQISHRQP